MSRLIEWSVPGLLALPVAAGLAGVALPAFGYLPALGGEAFTLAHFKTVLAAPGIMQSIMLSAAAGLVTTAVSVAAVALFLAAFLGTRVFDLTRQGLAPVLAVPHAAAAFGLLFLVAPSGMVFRLLALPLGLDRPPDLLIIGDPLGLAMMVGLVAKELPFLLLVAFAALPQADVARRVRLARSLGYGRVAAFLMTTWPSVYRQIRLPVIAVAAFASSVVDVALILGPSTPPPLAARLLEWMNDPDLSLRFAASAGALVQLAVTLAVIGTWLVGERLAFRLTSVWIDGGRRLQEDRPLRILAVLPVGLAAFSLFGGLAVLALWSVAGFWAFPDLLPPAASFSTWGEALEEASGPLWTTFVVALASGLAALVFTILMLEARRRSFPATQAGEVRLARWTAGLLYLPLIVPQIAFVFGLSILILFAGFPPSLPLLAAVHLVFVAPYVVLALAGPWFALDPRYERVARSLGRSRLATFLRVRLPLLAAPILAALAIGIAVSVGQYLPTVLVGAGRLPTITTEAVALSSGGNRRVIGAYALLQTALPFLAFAWAGLVPHLLARHRRGMRPQ